MEAGTGNGNGGVVYGWKAGIGLVVRGARIDARDVTEACRDVRIVVGHAGDHVSCTRLPRDCFRTVGMLGA